MEPSSIDVKPKGIDILDALSILDSRPTCGGHHGLKHEEASSKNGVEEMKSMGQIIDLFDGQTKMNPDSCDCTSSSLRNNMTSPEEEESNLMMNALEEKKKIEAVRKERAKELSSKLAELSVRDLVKAVLEAQNERISTYKSFDEGLQRVLTTGNITDYPSVCADATAAFSVLSDTINNISQILVENHKRKDLGKIIKDLQSNEKEKLNTTAALHLERIREKNEKKDEAIKKLFRDRKSVV